MSQAPGLIPVLGWGTYHGMDKVWNKLKEDNILLQFQAIRIIQMVQDLFLYPEKIKDQDVRFLDLLLKRKERSNPTSFTVLALAQLLDAIESNGHHELEKDPYVPRRAFRPPRTNPIREILPDYYLQSSGYTKEDVEKMLSLTEGVDRVGFALRAGLVQNTESVEQVSRLLVGYPNRFLIVSAKPLDKDGRESIKGLLNKVGTDRVLIELSEQNSEIMSRIPQPKEPRSSSSSSVNINSSIIFHVFNIIIFFSLKNIT